jgi:hypothetical protein
LSCLPPPDEAPYPLYAEMVASAARVELNRSDLCKGIRSCSIILVPGSAVTKRASGVSSGILVHHNHGTEKNERFGGSRQSDEEKSAGISIAQKAAKRGFNRCRCVEDVPKATAGGDLLPLSSAAPYKTAIDRL